MTKSTGVGRGFRPLRPRFWAKVDMSGVCWEWQSIRTSPSKGGPGGYGLIAVNGRKLFAHRVAWELTNGPIPAGMYVLHRCDNPSCVRPGHLFLGTYSDNARDMFAKGRGNQKLTPLDVKAIRAARAEGASVSGLAERYKVNRTAITRILRSDRWGWV